MKFIPDGRCIYCPNPSDSDEHVVPLGLNGNYVLRMASCSVCRNITSKFEMSLLRGSFLQLRVAHKFKTRRPKKRPTSFPLIIERDGQENEVYVSASQHPMVLNMPLFPIPSLVSGLKSDPVLRPSGGVIFHINQIEHVLSANSVHKVALVEELQYKDFARLLAKVAYGFLIGELGRSRVKGDYLLPIILGDTSSAGMYIGSSDKNLNASESDPPALYQSYRLPERLGGNEVAIVTVRLFPHMLQNPAYIVICDLHELEAII